MRFSSPIRTDLVISMTLAETFLLLLFVVWYGHTSIIKQDPVALMKERLARFNRENDELARKLEQAKNQIADLNNRLDFWHQLTGFESPPTAAGLAEWRKEACRSNPKCEENNVLIHASVVKGQVSIVLLAESPRLSKWLVDSGRPKPELGVPLTDQNTIQRLLDGIREYYSNVKANDAECRFDYRLTYESKEDYYDGRELFERYFYPAGLNRTGTRGRVTDSR